MEDVVKFRHMAEHVASKVENDPLGDHGERRTGRTGRQVLRALFLASLGQKVLYMSTHEDQTRHAFLIAADVTHRTWGVGEDVKIMSVSRVITFWNGGMVEFKNAGSREIEGKHYHVATDDIN